MREELQKFGTVTQYEEIEGKFHIRIEGFENKMELTNEAMKLVLEANPTFPKVDKINVNKGIFHLILKK